MNMASSSSESINNCTKCRWELDVNQYVEISSRNRVAFRYCSNNSRAYRGVSLTQDQFQCLCNIITCNELKENTVKRKLGDKLWITLNYNGAVVICSQIEPDYQVNRFFHFMPAIWTKYISEIHNHVIDALCEKNMYIAKRNMKTGLQVMKTVKKKTEQRFE